MSKETLQIPNHRMFAALLMLTLVTVSGCAVSPDRDGYDEIEDIEASKPFIPPVDEEIIYYYPRSVSAKSEWNTCTPIQFLTYQCGTYFSAENLKAQDEKYLTLFGMDYCYRGALGWPKDCRTRFRVQFNYDAGDYLQFHYIYKAPVFTRQVVRVGIIVRYQNGTELRKAYSIWAYEKSGFTSIPIDSAVEYVEFDTYGTSTEQGPWISLDQIRIAKIVTN